MLRIVTKMSASSDVLDSHSTSTAGPVISVSCGRGAVMKEIPVRSTLPAALDGAEELTPAWEGGLAAYVVLPSVAGGASTISPSGDPSLFWRSTPALRNIFVHRVRVSGHSCSKRNW